MEAFQKANFLRMRLCYIKNDMEKETRGGLSSYQKTLTRIHELSKMYGYNPISLLRWGGWEKFCLAYEIFLRSL